MARKSIKKEKSLYQEVREELGLSRAQASELLEGLSESQIEKIENGKTPAEPGDILLMANKYKRPDLCNYFCANECQIGQRYVPEVKIKDLPQIVLEVLASLNTLNQKKDRFIEIAADGELSQEEIEDFVGIKDNLRKVSISFDALQLWLEHTISTGRMDKDLLESMD